jgi:glycosyltransferase involved in cell wall biosynthesis
MDDLGLADPRSIERHIERGSDILGLHGGAQLPGDDVARVVVEDGRQIEPSPADDLEIGEVKSDFLGEARALLFPIEWPESFGLVMIEAMACGTPVLAFRAGSVPEIIDQGVTGLIVDSVEEAIAAMPRVLSLDRAAVLRRFEERFSVTRMARDYVSVYEDLLHRLPAKRDGANGLLARGPDITSRPSRGQVPTLAAK